MSSSLSESVRSRLVLSNDKGAIILDIGKVYTRCGFSGEPAPRHIIKSQVVMNPYGQIQDVWDPKYTNRDELYLILCRFLRQIYLKYLMVHPRDYRVVVVESLLCPAHFRNTLARTLFNNLNVPHAAFVPSHLISLFTIARSSALVVDVGYNETTVLPVYEGIPLVAAWQATSYAAKAVKESVKALLQERAMVTSTNTGDKRPIGALQVDSVIEASLEDIIVRTCFVRSKTTPDDWTPPPVDYPLSSEYILHIDGHTRDSATNVLFEDQGLDEAIPACILDALLKCSMDSRRELSENILVTGGTVTLPGFNYRLKQELMSLVTDKCQKYSTKLGALQFSFHEAPSQPNCTAWLGASVFGSSEMAVLERAISLEKFKELKQLPDWTSCDPDQREQFRAVPTRKLLPSVPSSVARRQTYAGKT